LLPDSTSSTTYGSFPIKGMVGTHNVVWITLDSLRYDVAQQSLHDGCTPQLARLFPDGWECRHAPGTFTLPSHVAMFAGFLPTPVSNPKAPRLFAARMPGSDSITPDTFMFEESSVPAAFTASGYHTICVGGVGFFNPTNETGSILPSYFDTSYWKPHYGPGRKESVRLQVELAIRCLTTEQPTLLFINIATTHHPTKIYVEGATHDSVQSQAAALRHVDQHLEPLIDALLSGSLNARPTIVIVCADHGDAFGEDGYVGHRHPHRTVMEVPYAHVVLGSADPGAPHHAAPHHPAPPDRLAKPI
jgi:hypothetical protein